MLKASLFSSFDAITDAVLAIIATLMELEIKVPELKAGHIQSLLVQIGTYAISFTLICILWLNHHHIFHGAKKIDTVSVWLNFLLLFVMSLLPLATRLISESFHEYRTQVFYGAVLSVATALYSLLQARAATLAGERLKQHTYFMNWLATIICLISIPLSLVSVYCSGAIFLLVPALYFVVSGRPARLEKIS